MIDLQQIHLQLSFILIIACVNTVDFCFILIMFVQEKCHVPDSQGNCIFSKTEACKISVHRFIQDVQWFLRIDNPDMPVNMPSSRQYSLETYHVWGKQLNFGGVGLRR